MGVESDLVLHPVYARKAERLTAKARKYGVTQRIRCCPKPRLKAKGNSSSRQKRHLEILWEERALSHSEDCSRKSRQMISVFRNDPGSVTLEAIPFEISRCCTSCNVANRQNSRQSLPTKAEYQRFAQQFVDLIVDPKRPWLVRYVVTGGLDRIPTDEEIDSGDFALRVLNRLRRLEQEGTEIIETSLYEALSDGDREFLVPYTRKWAEVAGFSREELRMLLKMGKSSSLKQSFKELNSKFAFRSGGKTKITHSQLGKIVNRAEQLRPAIEKVLKELSSQTSHTLEEILSYYRQDFPEACDFLTLHIQRLRQAFNNNRVVNRATTRISARARALADAMAGTDYDLAFSTSIDKVRAARRLARSQGPPENSPKISD